MCVARISLHIDPPFELGLLRRGSSAKLVISSAPVPFHFVPPSFLACQFLHFLVLLLEEPLLKLEILLHAFLCEMTKNEPMKTESGEAFLSADNEACHDSSCALKCSGYRCPCRWSSSHGCATDVGCLFGPHGIVLSGGTTGRE